MKEFLERFWLSIWTVRIVGILLMIIIVICSALSAYVIDVEIRTPEWDDVGRHAEEQREMDAYERYEQNKSLNEIDLERAHEYMDKNIS